MYITIILLITLLFLFLFYASYSIRSGVYIKTLSKNKKKGKITAITFDDGPHAVQTPKVLDILEEYAVNATFFCIGENIQGNENLLKRMDEHGHLVANHSDIHRFFFPLQSVKKCVQEIENCEKQIERIIGKRTRLFRPPFGVTNPLIARAVKKTGYTTIGWNIRSFDTSKKSREKVVARIKRKLRNGSVILLHDRLPESDVLLKMILEMLKTENYKVVSVEDLFDIKAYK